jgi:hypothetical protein
MFFGPKWHSPDGSMPIQRAQKSPDFQGPTHSHLPSLWIYPHQRHYVQGLINHRSTNTVAIILCLNVIFFELQFISHIIIPMVYTSVQGHLKINPAYGLSKKRWSLNSKLSRYSKLNNLGAVNCSVHLQNTVSRGK